LVVDGLGEIQERRGKEKGSTFACSERVVPIWGEERKHTTEEEKRKRANVPHFTQNSGKKGREEKAVLLPKIWWEGEKTCLGEGRGRKRARHPWRRKLSWRRSHHELKKKKGGQRERATSLLH